MYNHYGELATTVYEITKPVGTSLNGDIDYYSKRLERITGTILEAGVGSGRMLIPLLEDGLSVEGIDQSEEMLAACRLNLNKQGLEACLHHGDLATFFLGDNQFEAIIVPTATFCLIQTEKLAYQVLENFYRHLVTGGKVIIDLDLPFYPELGESSITSFSLNDNNFITYEQKIVEIDWLKQQTVSHLTYSKWVDGVLVKTELQQFLLRWYGINEFKLMLESVGFKDISISSDYDHNIYPIDSNQTITFEAYK